MEKMEKYSKEIDVAVLRSMFGAIPVVGGALNEVIFDIRGRVKQERLNRFIELLSEFFTNRPDFDAENLKSEDFGDLFEEVLRKVVQTKSSAKHKRYRDVLVNGIETSVFDIDNSSRFLDLISSLEEVEVIILSSYAKYGNELFQVMEEFDSLRENVSSLNQQMREELKLSAAGSANDKTKVMQELSLAKDRMRILEKKKSDLVSFTDCGYYSLNEGKFIFYKQSLCSKALLVDVGAKKFDYQPYRDVEITTFGIEFVSFLTK
ncbi:MAG: hypothetical protein EOP45_20415 [Sphingobacteriaceae bacterium]|nr:MAG: hypothetical protein EOP45_20415 [Sphingobacteriaceae bacterium]